jgi:hypothetical protein
MKPNELSIPSLAEDIKMATVYQGPNIEVYRRLMLKSRLKLEIQGIRFRVLTAPAVRKLMGSTTRSKKKLLAEYTEWLKQQGCIR